MAASDDVIDAKLGRISAETDTKIVRLEGKLDLVLSKLDNTNDHFTQVRMDIADSRRATIANAWVIFGALVVVVGILVTVAPVVFDMGFKWRETISKEVQERIPAAPGTGQAVPMAGPSARPSGAATPPQ